ncbi:hypothetical protein BE08_12675 [Sorangium cellulosum]|uniref:Secreted protein n=1 Tax=Sorangium cellulosum TaxID=56 RepID=A0A150NZS2_SORCE|nr:hypothetical protein BE08_12675 [Sorangium cellulosum]
MKIRVLSIVAGAACVVGSTGAARAAAPPPPACAAAAWEGPVFTQNKRLCYETLAARGSYQEIVDLIEVESLGLTPQERYFLGAAYFGLSNRTGADSLRCHAAVRASGLLEAFLTEQQVLFREQHSFGTSDDMKYTYHATKMMAALEAVKGCEESSHTPASLERYGRRYAVERLRGLFYETSGPDALRDRFDEKMTQLGDQMKAFVATASSVETRYGLNLTELDVGRQYLFGIKDRINGLFGADAVKVAAQPVGGDESFPSFVYDATWRSQILGTIGAKATRFTDLLLPEKRGEIAIIEAEILGAIGGMSMEEYVSRKEQTVVALRDLSTSLILGTNFWTAMEAPERAGRAALDDALAKPNRDALARTAAHVEALWQEGMAKYCNPSRPAWYCRRAP